MSRRKRFESLEKEREVGEPLPARPTATQGRFGSLLEPRPDPASELDRSGCEPARFEPAPPASETIRVLETGDACFVRCAECRFDNFPTATCCRHCHADLTSPAQRSYSEAFWTKRAEEKLEEDRELESIRQRRAEADRQAADAMRQLVELEQQLSTRHTRGLPWDERDGIVQLVQQNSRRYGLVIGEWTFRVFPNRVHRILFFVALAAGFVGLALALLPAPLVVVILGLTGLSMLFRRLASWSRGRG
jgi:hypothetical protein